MTTTDKWNKIVEIHNKHINDKEDITQNLWENIFIEFFGFSRFNDEIERHRNIQIGSTERIITDIILKEDDSDLFIVELKQHNLPKNKTMELQLMSYLKQLRLSIGILVCDKIYIYDYDYKKADDEQIYAVIDFERNSLDGERFIDMFSKGNFTKASVASFIQSQNNLYKIATNIREELTADLILKLLKNHFAEKYNEKVFDEVIVGFDIAITPKNILRHNTTPLAPVSSTEKISNLSSDTYTLGKPFQIFSIADSPCDKNTFERYLRSNDSSVVNVTLFYRDQQQEQKIWRVNNFGPHSNLSGNLASGFLRDWNRKGIIGIELKL